MKNRFFTLFLAFVASCACMYAETYSGTCGAQGDNLTWELDSETGVLSISGTGAMKGWNLQNQAPWYPYSASILSVIIEDGIINIGQYAFYYCTGLTSVTIPNSVTSIGQYAFSSCSSLTSVTIPNSVTSIGYYAFAFCSGLTSLTIPNSVTTIGESAFRSCSGLTSISVEEGNMVYDSRNNCNAIIETATNTLIIGCINTIIPNSVTSIGLHAFSQCSALTSIEIPNSVTTIGYGAFEDCSGLTSIEIPNSVTRIADWAFGGCSSLNSVTIPNSITNISYCAFRSCSSLTSLTIPNSVSGIGGTAFAGCTSLTSLTCEAVTPPTLESHVFYSVNKSLPLYVPALSVDLYKAADQWKDFTNIQPICPIASGYCGAEGDSTNLRWELSCDSVLTISGTGAMADFYAFAPWESYVTIIKDILLPDGLANIGEHAFEAIINVTSITIPNSVANIGRGAFHECDGLMSIVLPTTITSIQSGTFSACTNLKSIELPKSVSSIGNNAFYFCHSLSSFTCHAETPPSLGSSALDFNKSGSVLYVPAQSVDLYKAAGQWKDFTNIQPICPIASGYCGAEGNNLTWELSCDSVLTISGTGAMEDYCYGSAYNDGHPVDPMPIDAPRRAQMLPCSGSAPWDNYTALITGIQIADGVTHIGKDAFCYCSSLTNDVVIPSSVTSIGNMAFYQCAELGRVIFTNATPPAIGDECFYNCSCSFTVPCNSNEAYIAVLGVESNRVELPEGCEPAPCLIASGYCGAEGDSTNLRWELSCDSVLSISGTGAMVDYQSSSTPWNGYSASISAVIIEDSVTSIGNCTFMHCSSLTSIVIPNSVTSIGNFAFYECSGLTSIDIPNSVTNIGNYVFTRCAGLVSINVATDNPTYCSVDGILFDKNKTTLLQYPGNKQGAYTIPNTVTSIGNYAFAFCSGLTSIDIPNSVTTIRDDAFQGCGGLTTIVVPNSVTTIQYGVFRDCRNLTSVILGNSVTTIREHAFYDCWALTSIVIPYSVTSIEENAFNYCRSLTSITNYASTPQTINSNVFGYVDISACTLYVRPISLSAYRNAEGWNDFADIQPIPCVIASGYCGAEGDSTNLRWELGCDSVLTICGKGAMADYQDTTSVPWFDYRLTAIKGIVLSDSITSIGNQAFYSCYQVSKIVLPNGIERIGRYAFALCSQLATINIPNSVTSIGERAFYGCQAFPVVDGLRYADKYLTGYVDNQPNYTICKNTKWIGTYAFSYNKTMTGVYIPSSVQYIESHAFGECRNLTAVYNHATTPQIIGADVFENVNKSACSLYVPAESIALYRAAEVWKDFENILPIEEASDPCIMEYGTCGTEGDNLTWKATCDGVLTLEGSGAIKMSPYILGYPWKVWLTYVSKIYLPEGITDIPASAFSPGLLNNTHYTSVTCYATTPPNADANAFSNPLFPSPINCTLYVPEESIELYRNAPTWKDFTNIQPICISYYSERSTYICGFDTYYWNGQEVRGEMLHDTLFYDNYWVKRTGGVDTTIVDTAKTIAGCDSVSIVHIHYATTYDVLHFDTIMEGEIFTINAERFEAVAGNTIHYTDALLSIEGCDSIVNYEIVVLPRPRYNLSVSANNPAYGTVEGAGVFVQDTMISIIAYPNEGHYFSQWSDGVTDNPRQIIVMQDSAFTAIFDVIYYPVFLLGYDGTLLSEQSVAHGQAAQVPEIPARDEYTFSGWTVDIEHITARTFAIAVYDKIGGTVIYKAEDGEIIGSENVDLHLPAAPMISGKTFSGWLTESVDSESGIVLRATYTTDNPTTHDDVSVVPSSTTAAVRFPFITGTLTYELIIRDLFGRVVCKIMFNASGHLLGIALAPGRERAATSDQSEGFNFTVEGLDPNTTYEYDFVAHDDTDEVIETLSGSFTTTDNVETTINNAPVPSGEVRKILENDQVVIIRNNEKYSVIGQKQ